MKGMLSFLEKAGLVRLEVPTTAVDTTTDATLGHADSAAPAPTPIPSSAQSGTSLLNLDEIYANAGVPEAKYPAERLLRVLDGLAALDDATRIMTIKAIDAADESWTIADPVADAIEKARALSTYADLVQTELQQREVETLARLEQMRIKNEEVVGNIRKQIADLEALAQRELARSITESTELQASLNAAKERTAQELGELTQTRQRLQGLASQFEPLPNNPKD